MLAWCRVSEDLRQMWSKNDFTLFLFCLCGVCLLKSEIHSSAAPQINESTSLFSSFHTYYKLHKEIDFNHINRREGCALYSQPFLIYLLLKDISLCTSETLPRILLFLDPSLQDPLPTPCMCAICAGSAPVCQNDSC